MSTEKEAQGEVIIEPEIVEEKQSPALPEKKPEPLIDWDFVNKSKHYRFMDGKNSSHLINCSFALWI